MKYAAPTELEISFRGGFYNYAAPMALKWVPNAVKPINTSQTAAWDSVAGAQDFAGASRDIAGMSPDFVRTPETTAAGTPAFACASGTGALFADGYGGLWGVMGLTPHRNVSGTA
jgi:hypothetical protein